ncbi:phage tail sheath family protein [Desulfospira joergensenii]|uniref:phage tail sheath family protein n=1 Tax=Desulfospira joergensenii TaxID=53329 RepID=UPI0003B799E0|nr:phage tail sheath C-terminal domain-containing protein [Desulfospira joergensenii]
MPHISYPGIYIDEIPSGDPSIRACDTTTAAFVGKTQKGDLNRAVPVQTRQEYQDHFGTIIDDSFLAQSVDHFFMNGGKRCYIVRVPAPTRMSGVSQPDLFTKAFHALDDIDEISLLAAPGIGTSWITDAGMEYCENRRNLFYIGETGRGDRSASHALAFKSRLNPAGSRGAVYFPWILDSSGRQPVLSPPSGGIAGLYARTDLSKGVWKAPAGLDALLKGTGKPSCTITDPDQDRLNPAGINAIRKFEPTGTVVWGARTLSRDPEWRYVPIRRTAMMIEESISRGTRWAVFEHNDSNLWIRVKQTIALFLGNLFREGALQGAKDSEAFYVRCGRGETMTQADIDQGRLIIEIGIALLRPAEFIVLRIQQAISGK